MPNKFGIFEDLPTDKKNRSKKRFSINSDYITMPDGTEIAADIILERGFTEKRPTFLHQTRYWRATQYRTGFRWIEKIDLQRFKPLIDAGFNLVRVDVRGSGASSGVRTSPWSQCEIQDMNSIAEWITQQPWSDGDIITFGLSYSATTSELSATVYHPAIKGHIVCENEYDVYTDIAYPGGVFMEWFVKNWGLANSDLDRNQIKNLPYPFFLKILIKGVKPVQGRENTSKLDDFIHQHAHNPNVYEIAKSIDYRDDIFDKVTGRTIDDISVYTYTNKISKNGTPIMSCGSWFDATTATGVIHRFLNYENPHIAIIGSWNHGMYLDGNPFQKSKSRSIPSEFVQLQEKIRFAKRCLKDPDRIPKVLYYFTIRQQKWKSTSKWPPDNQEYKKFYFHPNNTLSFEPPLDSDAISTYQVNYSTTTGTTNRWRTQFYNPVIYKNRSKEDTKLLTFTSEPITNSLEVTGHPIINLSLSSTHEDGSLFVYFELVHNDKVYYLSEGMLRLIHWKLAQESSPYKSPIPYRSFKQKDAEYLTPDKIYNISFALEPISVWIDKGMQIRIAIAGADKDNFSIYPKDLESSSIYTIYHTKDNPSFVDIPMIQNDSTTN
ncbi:MAG: CocE/NonD family hydrolase [Candidatus Lokiarchaeota archaeon]|nr:CocE/NonD family hydrolase [Candidatus Lokiarchaeota archaeon]